MVHIVNQPFQAQGLRHLHAWHGVPERDCENLFEFACFTFPQPKYFESLQITCCPSYWQRKESAAAAPGCLGAAEKSCNLTLCKKVAFCNFPRKPTPSLPPSISILCYSTCSSMSSSSLATTILNRSLESTTKMMPCKVDMSRVTKVRRSMYLAVSVVVLPQVPVPALPRHVKGGEADVSVWKDNMSEEGHLQHLLAVILNNSAIKTQKSRQNIHRTCSELTSSIVRHHSLLGVLGQHQHKCLVHGALQRWWGCLFLSSIFRSIFLSFQLYVFNLSLWLPTWSTILLPAWMTTLVASTPWTVSPSCTSGEAVTAVDFFSDFCFSSGYQSCGLKGKFTAGKGNSSLWEPTSFRTLISHTWELSNHTITVPIKEPFRS